MDSFSGKRTEGTQGVGPGTRLGIFELREPLGRGGMGQVWLARDTQGNRDVAVKLLPPELRGNADAIEQVAAAFRVVHALTHQNIGKTIGLFIDLDHGPHIVMDLVGGIPLSKYAREFRAAGQKLSPARVAEILRPVAEALDYAHRKSVLHRDVKPQNILVQHRPDFSIEEVVLIDFGLAAEIRSSLARHTQARIDASGTRPYMSPEQLRGKPGQWDGRTDQYSLAVVAYELLAGHLPFETEDDAALMMAVLNEPPDPIPGLPASVNGALLRGLAKDKEGRAATCAEWVAGLEGRTGKTATDSKAGTRPGEQGGPKVRGAGTGRDRAPGERGAVPSPEAQRLRGKLLVNLRDGPTRHEYLEARTEYEVRQDRTAGVTPSSWSSVAIVPQVIGVYLAITMVALPVAAMLSMGAAEMIFALLIPFLIAAIFIVVRYRRRSLRRRGELWERLGPLPWIPPWASEAAIEDVAHGDGSTSSIAPAGGCVLAIVGFAVFLMVMGVVAYVVMMYRM